MYIESTILCLQLEFTPCIKEMRTIARPHLSAPECFNRLIIKAKKNQ
jgi:hypothetical protein